MKKTALVTGANKGIGLEICRQLKALNYHVLLGCRDESRGIEAAEALGSGGVHVVVIDIDKPSTFADAHEWIAGKFGQLDVLVNNAGGADPADWQSTAETLSVDVLRRTFELNFFGLVELTQQLLPLLKKSPAPRIVNQSSILASLSEHSNPQSTIYGVNALAYDASKTAVNAFTVHLAKVLRDTPFKVNSAHPGSVLTDLNPGGELSVERGAQTAVRLATLPADGPTGSFFYFDEVLAW
jgi:NAD(P)-dependent dehydrogenase (short-subunit alcohol dehydrogenase family)